MTDTDKQTDDVQIVEPENSLPEITLDQLPELLGNAARRANWTELMPVQKKAIPYLQAKRDLMVQSRTGSGKTGAFILPAMEIINPEKNCCQALVMVPTRELAKQVASETEMLAGDTGIRSIAVYGGVAYGPQLEAFKQGAHIVIGTPGRLLDHLLKRSLSLKSLKMIILDEADRMLSMGFYPDMQEIHRHLPDQRVNCCMFSATFPPHVMGLSGEFMHNPETLSLSRDHVHVTEVEHIMYTVPPMEKDRALVRIIEIENPASAIIFCNTRAKVDYVNAVLQRFGYDADRLSSDLPQKAREEVLGRVRRKDLRFLVATDVAARGIDIQDLSHIFMYEPPEDPESYIHRAGRTGRAGASGEAVTLVSAAEKLEMARIEKQYKIEIQEKELPTDEDVQQIVAQRITALLEARLRSRDSLETERMQRFVSLGRSLAENEDESALIAMLLDDYYQQTLHGAPPAPAPVSAPSVKNAKKKPRPKKRSSRRRNGKK